MIKRLQEIATEKTMNIQVKYVLNQSVIDKNFTVIIQCLKDLDNYKQNSDKQFKIIEEKNTKLEKQISNLRDLINKKSNGDNQNDKKQNSDSTRLQNNNWDELKRKFEEQSEKNRKNNLQSAKDLNSVLKDIKDLKQKITNLEDQLHNSKSNTNTTQQLSKGNQKKSLDNIRIVQNQIQKQLQDIRNLEAQIQKLKITDQNLEDMINKILNSKDINNSTDLSKSDMDDVLQRLKLLQKIITKQDSNTNDQRTNNNINKIVDDKLNKFKQWQKSIEQKLEQLQNLLNESNNNQKKSEVTQFQSDHKKKESINSDRNNKNQYLLNDFDKRLQIAQNRIDDLQLLLRQKQKNSPYKLDNKTQEKKEQKLPSINRNLKKITKERQHNSKDLNNKNNMDLDKRLQQLKIQLQHWLRQLLQNRNNNGNKNGEESLRDLQLKMQQLKMMIQKKADQQGVKKYLTFLQNKINQIYLVLSQPESEDALIARKGWNCLSCAKKLEKYRGKLGDHVNWNNLTTANYSPPRVGFTQTYKSSQRNKFISMADKKSLGYEGQTEKIDE